MNHFDFRTNQILRSQLAKEIERRGIHLYGSCGDEAGEADRHWFVCSACSLSFPTGADAEPAPCCPECGRPARPLKADSADVADLRAYCAPNWMRRYVTGRPIFQVLTVTDYNPITKEVRLNTCTVTITARPAAGSVRVTENGSLKSNEETVRPYRDMLLSMRPKSVIVAGSSAVVVRQDVQDIRFRGRKLRQNNLNTFLSLHIAPLWPKVFGDSRLLKQMQQNDIPVNRTAVDLLLYLIRQAQATKEPDLRPEEIWMMAAAGRKLSRS